MVLTMFTQEDHELFDSDEPVEGSREKDDVTSASTCSCEAGHDGHQVGEFHKIGPNCWRLEVRGQGNQQGEDGEGDLFRNQHLSVDLSVQCSHLGLCRSSIFDM